MQRFHYSISVIRITAYIYLLLKFENAFGKGIVGYCCWGNGELLDEFLALGIFLIGLYDLSYPNWNNNTG
jgi:hypothetical protein